MMAVYLWEVYYLSNDPDAVPVMAAHDFVMTEEFSNWAKEQSDPIDLMKQDGIFDAVWSWLEKIEVGSYLEAIRLRYFPNRGDHRLVDFSEAYRRVMGTDGSRAGDLEGSDAEGTIVPSGEPPSASNGIQDTLRPLLKLLGVPSAFLGGAVGAFLAGSDEAIRRTANFRNITETAEGYQNDHQRRANIASYNFRNTPGNYLVNTTPVGYTIQELEYAKRWGRQHFHDPNLPNRFQFVESDRETAQWLIDQYRKSGAAGTDSGYYESLLEQAKERDAMSRLGQAEQLRRAARAQALQSREALPYSEAFGRPGQPQLVNNGTIPRLLNQSGPSGSRIFNWSASDSDSFAQRLLYAQQRGTEYFVDPDQVNSRIDPELLRRAMEESQSDAQDEGNGTSTRRIEIPSGDGSARGPLEVGLNGPVRRAVTWAGYNDPAQFDPRYDVMVEGRRVPRFEVESRPPTADEALREYGARVDAVGRWVARTTGNAITGATQGAAGVVALPFNLLSGVLGNGGGGPLAATGGDLDSAPEGSRSPSSRRKRAFLDHTQTA
jgi:hypothetical protein